MGYAVVLTAVARLIWTLLRDASLDPAHGALEAGACRVVAVADDGTLDVAQPLASDAAEPPRRAVVRRVRLLGVSRSGVSSGESKSRRSPAKHDLRAAQWLRATVQGQEAWLEFDRRRFDDEGCWLAYVHLRDRLVNVELVRAGWGRCEVQPGDSAARQRELRRAEIEARRAGRGAWGPAAPELVPAGPPG